MHGMFYTTMCGAWRGCQVGDKGNDQSTEASPSFPRSSLSSECLMSSTPSIGTGSPICSKGAWRLRNRQPTQRPNARDCGVGGRVLPTRHPLGRTLISRQQNWGTSGAQCSLCPCPCPCPWTPPVARWLAGKGVLPGGLPGPGERVRDASPLDPPPSFSPPSF